MKELPRTRRSFPKILALSVFVLCPLGGLAQLLVQSFMCSFRQCTYTRSKHTHYTRYTPSTIGTALSERARMPFMSHGCERVINSYGFAVYFGTFEVRIRTEILIHFSILHRGEHEHTHTALGCCCYYCSTTLCVWSTHMLGHSIS